MSKELEVIKKIAERSMMASDLRVWLWLSAAANRRVFVSEIAAALCLSQSSVHGALSRLREGRLVESGEGHAGKVYRVVRDPGKWKPLNEERSGQKEGAADAAQSRSV